MLESLESLETHSAAFIGLPMGKKTSLRIFKSRLHFVRALRNFSFDETMPAHLAEANYVSLKLAFSAELLKLALSITGAERKICDSKISRAVVSGQLSVAIERLELSSTKKFAEHLQKDCLVLGKDANLIELVLAFRNLAFHGKLTPTGIGIADSKIRRELLLGFALNIENQAEALVDKYLLRLLAKEYRLSIGQ